jgi:hypothetical protein
VNGGSGGAWIALPMTWRIPFGGGLGVFARVQICGGFCS